MNQKHLRVIVLSAVNDVVQAGVSRNGVNKLVDKITAKLAEALNISDD